MTARADITGFDAAWRAHLAVLRRQAAILFDDPRLDPPPSPDDLLRDIRPAIAARWYSPEVPTAWLLTEATRELLGRGWVVYDGPLRGLLARKVWCAADVDELLQGAAARSLQRLPELVARPRPLFGWLCLLARQQRVDWLRRGGDRRSLLLADALPDLADSGTTPTQAERRARVREMYDQVLARLGPDDARLIRLSTEQCAGPGELARQFGITELNARQRLFRARCAAARAWQELFPGAAAELAPFGVFPPGTVAS